MRLDLPTPPKSCKYKFLVKCVINFTPSIFPAGPSDLLLQTALWFSRQATMSWDQAICYLFYLIYPS